MSDHQDTHHFTYDRSWNEIEIMLDRAERLKNTHETKFLQLKGNRNRKELLHHARNMKALEGVIKTLRWTLGDKEISHPLD